MPIGHTYIGDVAADKWGEYNRWLNGQPHLHRFGMIFPGKQPGSHAVMVRFAQATPEQIAKLKEFGLSEKE